jgi:hypothetical protein
MNRSRVKMEGIISKGCLDKRRKVLSKSLANNLWGVSLSRLLKMKKLQIAAVLEGLLHIYLKKKSRSSVNRKILQI